MQTLYGIKISDRVTVDEYQMGGTKTFGGRFDGEPVGNIESTGAAAVRGVIKWLNERAEQKKLDQQLVEQQASQDQENKDEFFLNHLAQDLGIYRTDLDELIEVIKRRIA